MFRDIVLWHLDKKILKLENKLAELRMLKWRLLNMKEIVKDAKEVPIWILKINDFYEIRINELGINIREKTIRQAFVRLGNKLKTIKKKKYEKLVGGM